MWRRWGDYIYALLVLVVFGAEAVGILLLSFAFLGRLFGLVHYGTIVEVAVLFVILTCVALAVVMMHVLVYCAISAHRDRNRRTRAQAWTDLFVAWLFDRSVNVPARMPREGVEALLELRENISGDDGVALGELIENLGVIDTLLRRARSRRLATKLQAIEGLAKARSPRGLDLAYELLSDPTPVVRFMATRVIARTLAVTPEPDSQRFIDALHARELPGGVVEEALLLLDDVAPSVIGTILTDGKSTLSLVRAALDAAGRLFATPIAKVAPAVARWVASEEPELEAAAMQCAARMHLRDPSLTEPIARAATAETEFVRLQATRALAVIKQERALPALWDRLHDSSWWVRHAAADTLQALGPPGIAELRRARTEHPDRYARQMAHHVLLETELGGVA